MADIAAVIIKKIFRGREKITRDTFLYMDPRGPDPKGGEKYQDFAQCGTCMMFTGDYLEKGERKGTCTILNPKEVDALASCGLYVPGKNHTEMKGKETYALGKKESGYVDHLVRCENCVYFEDDSMTCILFHKLNQEMPKTFELDDIVQAKGCCNAQTPRY